MYWRALAASAAAIALSMVAMSPIFGASAATTVPATTATSTTAPAAESIAAVQGTGATTPFAGRSVAVRGVVTAVLPSFGGVFVQSATSAGIVGASDGIFVATSRGGLATGDLVAVTGVAREAASQTEIAADAVTVLRASVALPAATPLPDSVVGSAREAFEGMLVTPVGSYFLVSTDGTTGSLVLSAGTKRADAATRLTLDDGYSGRVASQPFLLPDTVVRAGDSFVAPRRAVILAQGASGYRLEPSTRVTTSSASSYKPTFEVAGPRLGSAPVVTP